MIQNHPATPGPGEQEEPIKIKLIHRVPDLTLASTHILHPSPDIDLSLLNRQPRAKPFISILNLLHYKVGEPYSPKTVLTLNSSFNRG